MKMDNPYGTPPPVIRYPETIKTMPCDYVSINIINQLRIIIQPVYLTRPVLTEKCQLQCFPRYFSKLNIDSTGIKNLIQIRLNCIFDLIDSSVPKSYTFPIINTFFFHFILLILFQLIF